MSTLKTKMIFSGRGYVFTAEEVLLARMARSRRYLGLKLGPHNSGLAIPASLESPEGAAQSF